MFGKTKLKNKPKDTCCVLQRFLRPPSSRDVRKKLARWERKKKEKQKKKRNQ